MWTKIFEEKVNYLLLNYVEKKEIKYDVIYSRNN